MSGFGEFVGKLYDSASDLSKQAARWMVSSMGNAATAVKAALSGVATALKEGAAAVGKAVDKARGLFRAVEKTFSKTETPRQTMITRCPKSCAQAIPMDTGKFPDQRAMHGNELKSTFPKLGENYEILAPATVDYNCIAHTLGINDEWVDPLTGSKENPLSEMTKMYAEKGYTLAKGVDTSYDQSIEKIIVYATKNADGSINKVTHGAIQDAKGTFESKLGGLPLIRHLTAESLNGALYGEPVAVFEK